MTTDNRAGTGTKDFDTYFHETVEYPDPTAHDLTKSGWRFDYVSSTFLNGWINYVKPISAFVVSRYSDDFPSVIAHVESWKASPPPHTNFGELDDDVYVLAKDESGRLWCFEFDCDVSDCSIGVLDLGADTEAVAIASFVAYAQSRARRPEEAIEIPTSVIRGWVSFR